MQLTASGARARTPQITGAVCLVASLLWAAIGTWHWPLAGDAALMHYVVFATRHGATPYRDLVDLNYPGTYALEALSMRLFGDGPTGLRLYDFSLVSAVVAACLALAGRRRWFGGLLAGSLFALVHFQDGVAQQAQRDLLLAALLLWGLAAFQRAHPGAHRGWFPPVLFGLCFGLSLTVKPVLLPIALGLFALGLFRSRPRPPLPFLLLAASGLLAPPLVVSFWLERHHALAGFLYSVRVLGPAHATLGRRPLGFLLAHSLAPVSSLAVLALLLLLFARRPPDGRHRPRTEWLLVILGALLAYLVQGKGLPYQRYPFLAVLLLGVGLVCDRSLGLSQPVRGLAVVTVLLACCGLAPWFALKATRFNPKAPFEEALAAALLQLGPPAALSRQVQCLDTYAGCVNTLYDLRLEQSTGFLYDCYLFSGSPRVEAGYRDRFQQAYRNAQPRILVLTSRRCFGSAGDAYSRVADWPYLAQELRSNYQLVQHWTPTQMEGWSSRGVVPAGFEVFVRRAGR